MDTRIAYLVELQIEMIDGAVHQYRSTTVPRVKKVFNSAENYQFLALFNTFIFSSLLYFGTVKRPLIDLYTETLQMVPSF